MTTVTAAEIRVVELKIRLEILYHIHETGPLTENFDFEGEIFEKEKKIWQITPLRISPLAA